MDGLCEVDGKKAEYVVELGFVCYSLAEGGKDVTNYFACAPVPQTGNRSHFAYRHWRVERVVFHALFHGGENYEIVVRNLIKFTFNFTILNDGFQNLTCQRLRKHLVESHSVQITPEHYTFNTDAEFDYWKHTIEDKMKVNYVKDSGRM
ncbi:hypothetical protein HUJ04_006960 [Dendroctonus ponderosae]|nr:hypothetical protein HUJ04_006960 [Dendroctonus ponderosae]